MSIFFILLELKCGVPQDCLIRDLFCNQLKLTYFHGSLFYNGECRHSNCLDYSTSNVSDSNIDTVISSSKKDLNILCKWCHWLVTTTNRMSLQKKLVKTLGTIPPSPPSLPCSSTHSNTSFIQKETKEFQGLNFNLINAFFKPQINYYIPSNMDMSQLNK